MIARYEGNGEPAFAAYGLDLSHKHLPEMKQHAGLDHAPVFLPSVGDFAQGMLVNIPLHQDQFTRAVSFQADVYVTDQGHRRQRQVHPCLHIWQSLSCHHRCSR